MLFRSHIPKGGESVIYEGRRLTVVEMDGRRISKVRVEPVEDKPAAADKGERVKG